jgi:integrase
MEEPTQANEPSITELRNIIDGIPDILEVPCWGKTIKIDGAMIRSLDRFLYLTGCRVSEVITEAYKTERALGGEAVLSLTTYKGVDVALFTLSTLKRKSGLRRNIALPATVKDPWVRKLALEWSKTGGRSPYRFTRRFAYVANKTVFDGYEYVIEDQRVQLKDGTVLFEKEKHNKQSSNHGLRHFRARELTQDYGFTDNDLMTFFGWSPVSFGKNPYMQRYQNLRWQDYFDKLLTRVYP